MMIRLLHCLIIAISLLVPMRTLYAAHPLFDLEETKLQLQAPKNEGWRALCEAPTLTLSDSPPPIPKILSTDDYGTKNETAPFAWQVMVLGGRALAGNNSAAHELAQLLLHWADAHALLETDISQDSYYELKRTLLPTILNFAIIAPDLPQDQRSKIEHWLGQLVAKIDHDFGGLTDSNNHRQLTDSVLMSWAQFTEDDTLYIRSQRGFQAQIDSLNARGMPPLEITRGARAGWYIRQTLSSMSLMAHIATQKGDELFAYQRHDADINALLHGFLNNYYAPFSAFPEVAHNETPGPHKNYLSADMDYMQKRGSGRHYLAFSEILLANAGHLEDFTFQRFQTFIRLARLTEQRPLIDEFSGGNASCFFMGAH